MDRAEKERVVEELAERLRASDALIVADYRGLSVAQLKNLREELRRHGARFSIVKNTLTRRAAEAAGTGELLALLDGPTAIAFLESGGDLVAVAKALAETSRSTRVLQLRGGVLEGASVDAEQLARLATLPPTDVLRGQVLGALASPLYTIVGLFSAPLRDLVGLVDARIEQLAAGAKAPVGERAEANGGAGRVEPAADAISEPKTAASDSGPEPVAADPEEE
jgi:large subunit ribosomal protein L10